MYRGSLPGPNKRAKKERSIDEKWSDEHLLTVLPAIVSSLWFPVQRVCLGAVAAYAQMRVITLLCD